MIDLQSTAQKDKTRPRATIADVSKALGLTKSTVSRALNNYPDISESTKTRVRLMADQFGYVPLSHAQAIRTGRVRSLGLIVQMSDHDAHRPFLAEFLLGISQAASAEGWTVAIAASTSVEETLSTIQKMVRDRKVDGFILPRTQAHDPRVQTLREMHVPFVMFGRTHNSDGCAWFDVLGEHAMREAVGRLVQLGHSSIGFINGGAKYNYNLLRFEGFNRGLADQGLEPNSSWVHDNALTMEDGEAITHEMLRGQNPPTALVCAVDKVALGAHRAVCKLGLTPGKQVSIIGYDGIPEGAHVSPQLSTFAVDYIACGKRLAEMLIARARGAAAEELRETANASYLDRGSAGPMTLSSSELAQHFLQLKSNNVSTGGNHEN